MSVTSARYLTTPLASSESASSADDDTVRSNPASLRACFTRFCRTASSSTRRMIGRSINSANPRPTKYAIQLHCSRRSGANWRHSSAYAKRIGHSRPISSWRLQSERQIPNPNSTAILQLPMDPRFRLRPNFRCQDRAKVKIGAIELQCKRRNRPWVPRQCSKSNQGRNHAGRSPVASSSATGAPR